VSDIVEKGMACGQEISCDVIEKLKQRLDDLWDLMSETDRDRCCPDCTVAEAAAVIGQVGGLKGGRARAIKLTKERRSEIAKQADSIRWNKRNQPLREHSDGLDQGWQPRTTAELVDARHDAGARSKRTQIHRILWLRQGVAEHEQIRRIDFGRWAAAESMSDGLLWQETRDSNMYERFTDRSRKVMQLTNQEAQRFNHDHIGTEHILIGLVKEGSGVAANVLKILDVDLEKIRIRV
jgi:hypothetical protein